LIPVKVKSKIKGAMVYVDGESRGYVSRNEQGQIRLPPGSHRISFRSIACQDDDQEFLLRSGQKEMTLFFKCDWRPAFIDLRTPKQIPVRHNNNLLGETNQPIRFPMSSHNFEVSLTVGDQVLGFQHVELRLKAGQTTVEELDYWPVP